MQSATSSAPISSERDGRPIIQENPAEEQQPPKSFEGDGVMKGIVQGIWENGEIVYEGELNEKDEPHGRGKWKFSNGNVYEGQWENGNKHGKGVMTYANKDVYDGEWSNDKMHGKGVFEYAAGDWWKEVGEWKGGKKCGWFESFPRPKVLYFDDDDEVQTMGTEDFE